MNGPGPGGAHPFPNWGGDDRDNDSFKYLSEPSLSEECDSSTADRRSLLTPDDDDDDDEVDDEDRGATSTPPPPPPGPPPPLNSGASSGMASPGNTSLSSWESHFRPPNSRFHRVKIQFSPDSAQSSERHQYTGYGPNFYQPFQSAFYNNSSQPYQQQQQFLVPMSPLQQQQQQQQQQALTNNINETQAFSSNDLPNAAPDEEEEEDNPNNLSYSTFSYSTVSSSAKDRMRVDEFSSDLKQNSEGALQKSSEANNISMLNTSIDSSQYPKATLDTVMRNTPKEKSQDREHEVPGRHRRISSVDTELIGNTSDVVLEDNEDRYGEDTSSFMMTLSASEDEEGDQKVGDNSQSKEGATESKNNHDRIEKDSNGQHSRMKDGSGTSSAGAPASSESNHTSTEDDPRQVDSDHHQHSADDEQTTFRPPRKRIFAGGKPSPAHRRTRSGDSAAAALATGGKDWRGMDKDKIPLPIADDEDEDDEDNLAAVAPNNGKSDSGQDNNGSGKNRNGKKTNNSNNKDESAVFSVGAAEVAAASRAAARRQRREQRQEQRLLAEKAAAAAKEQRIKRQYQEFSNSPLWNYNKQYRDRVDSQDHQSLGSIPSTIVHPIKEQSHGDDERERPRPRLSFDTKSSIISSSTGDFGGGGLNRRDSESMFSRISHSQHGPEESPSPHLPRRSFQVYHQMGSPPMHGRHQRAHTLISGYGPIESRIQHQDSFRRYMQMQMQNQDPNHDSFHRYTIAQHHRSPDSHGSYRARSFPGHPLASSLGRDVYSPAWGGYRRRASPTSQSDSNNSSRSSESTSANRGEEEDEFMDIHANQTHQIPPSMFGSLDEVEQSVEAELLKHGSYQHVVRHARGSPFANFGRKSANDTSSSKFDRSSFLPKTSIIQEGGRGYPTYRCPNCQTIQREFFTVTNAPRHYEMASRYLALYFSIYVIASLYIFGLEVSHICFYFERICTLSLS